MLQGELDESREDIILFIHLNSIEVLISNKTIKEELLAQIVKGNTLDYIAEPIKETLIKASKVSSAVRTAETEDASSALTLDEAKGAIIDIISKIEFDNTYSLAYKEKSYPEHIKAGKDFEALYNELDYLLQNEKNVKKDTKEELMRAQNSLKSGILEDEIKKQGITAGRIEINLEALHSRVHDTRGKYRYFSPSKYYYLTFMDGSINKAEINILPIGDKINVASAGYMIIVKGLDERDGGDVKISVLRNGEVQVDSMSGRIREWHISNLKRFAVSIRKGLKISSAGSAIEEKEIVNAKKTELKGMITWLFRESEVIYNLQKAVWMLQLDRSDSPSTVKKICDDIIEWIDEDKNEPKKDKKPFKAFSDSLKVIAIIGELKSLALLLEVSPSIINKALKEIETVQDESQRRGILKELVNQLEAIMPADVEQLKKISASLNKSGSPLTKAEVIKIVNDFIELLKNQVIPNEDFLKRIELVKNTEEIKWLLPGLIRSNDKLMNALEELQKQIFKLLKADYLSPAQFDEQLKDTFENVVSGKVLVIGVKSDPDLIAMVKGIKEYYAQLSEKQPDPSKTSFNPEWIDSDKGRVELIKNADVIITRWRDIADYTAKHFEFGVRLSDGNRMILKKIPSSIPGQEARGEDASLTAVEAVKLAKEAIWGKETGTAQIAFPAHPGKPLIDAVKNMFKSILRDKDYTFGPVSYLSDFKKIVERCSGEVYGSNFASLFYAIKLRLRTSQAVDTKNDLDLRRLQGIINGAFEGYLKFIQINIPEFMSNPNLIVSQDLSGVIEFVNKKDVIVIKLPNKTKIGKSEVLACLEFIKEVTASSAITNEELKKKSEEMKSLRKQLREAIKVEQAEIEQGMEIWSKERIAAVNSQLHRDLLSQAQRGISDLGVAIASNRELLQKLIKQDIGYSQKSQDIDMIAKYINTFQGREERMLKAREEVYSEVPYTASLTLDDKKEISKILLKIKVESQEYYESLRKIYASSALTALPLGGIDFRQMNMLIQPVGSFSGLDFSPARLSSSALETMDLDKELESITRMASGGMLPSPQRLKEYISACIFKGKIGEKADDFILSMLEVFQLQAEEGMESSAEEREAVVMADTRRYVLEGAP